MNKMVKKYTTRCDSYQKHKQIKNTKEPFTITETLSHGFDTVVMNTVGRLRPSGQFSYILTMQCELTKYVVACLIESKDSKTVAKAVYLTFSKDRRMNLRMN